MTECFDFHKLMAVDRSSRKRLHSIELSRTIPSKPHKFVDGIFLFVFCAFFFVQLMFVCLLVCFYCLLGICFCLFNSFGDGILFSAEQSASSNLLPPSIWPDIHVFFVVY